MSIEQKARELLADEYRLKFGNMRRAEVMRGPWTMEEDAAIRAIAAALRTRQAGVDGEAISNADLCRLSRMFNAYCDLRLAQDQRINEWLKHSIAAAQQENPDGK
jgi:hypothetical protein